MKTQPPHQHLHQKDTMSKSRSLPGLALTATAALLGLTTVALPTAAHAAPGVPDQVTVALTTGLGTPGVAQTGTVTVEADGVPVANQSVTLSLDHGFFTTGDEKTPSVVGARAGNLEQSGTTLTDTTDGQGQLTFEVAIERDPGFDDDGRVDAVVTATAGAARGQAGAAWSSAHPLNGGSVDVVLSTVQENPVAPTVSGDRTAYDVVTRDQFGNAVAGEPVQVYPSGTSSFDYSDDFESNLDAFGDFWVVSDVPGTLGTTVTWADAPTTLYTDTLGGTAAGPVKDVVGSASVRYYDVSFAGSTYSLLSSAPTGLAPVGGSVTQTVVVNDQLGRPVRGLDVRFFRVGPDATDGNEKATRETNALGQASFTYVGTTPGAGKVTAVVSDGLSQRTLTGDTGFRWNITATLAGVKARGGSADTDVLEVRASKVAAGAKVRVYRVKGHGKLKAVKAKHSRLDKRGRATLEVKDTNKRRKTKYVVVVQPTGTTFAVTTRSVRVA
jgi:5-hydroxyisourate hydrolase-like protein (transthyretin family)